MGDDFNNSEKKQQVFREIRGIVTELNDAEMYCSITIEVGHHNKRSVNLVCKKQLFDSVISDKKIGDKVTVRYFISSRYKHGRWYTMANILAVHKF